MARKSGVVDLISVPEMEGNGKAQYTAELLCSIREERMRVGVERWVGLKITEECVLNRTKHTDSAEASSAVHPVVPSVIPRSTAFLSRRRAMMLNRKKVHLFCAVLRKNSLTALL